MSDKILVWIADTIIPWLLVLLFFGVPVVAVAFIVLTVIGGQK